MPRRPGKQRARRSAPRRRTREIEIDLREGEKVGVGNILVLKILTVEGEQARILVDEVSNSEIDASDGAAVIVKEQPPRQARATVIGSASKQLTKQCREELHKKKLERDLASPASHVDEAPLPAGDPPDYGPAIKLGDAIARYAEAHPLTATAARYAGEIAERALEAVAVGKLPQEVSRDAAMYLAKAGHLAEAGAMWNELRAADRGIAALEATQNLQDQSYRASRARERSALREEVRPALAQLIETSPNLHISEYARRLLAQYKRRLRRTPGRLPSERSLRRTVAELLPEMTES